MPLLNLAQYLTCLKPGAEKLTPSADESAAVLDYAAEVWESLQLSPRKLKPADIAVVYRHGDQSLYHVKAFPRKMPNTFVIVIADKKGKLNRHILIDLQAMYNEATLECPELRFNKSPTPEDIERIIGGLQPEMDNPFAILATGDGTYLQTYRDPKGFVLEYQLVNTSSHYEIPKLTTAAKVIEAFVSYNAGDNQWLEMFSWRKLALG